MSGSEVLRRRDERGVGTALALAVIGAVVALLVGLAAIALVLETRARVSGATDAAALAAADTAMGNATGVPCDRATALAADAGVVVADCAQRGALVRVRGTAEVLGLTVAAEAVAGPPLADP